VISFFFLITFLFVAVSTFCSSELASVSTMILIARACPALGPNLRLEVMDEEELDEWWTSTSAAILP